MTSVWEGYIVGLPTEESFWATVTDDAGKELCVEFPIDALSASDRHLIDEGSFIKWTVSFGASKVELIHDIWSQEELTTTTAKDLYDDLFST